MRSLLDGIIVIGGKVTARGTGRDLIGQVHQVLDIIVARVVDDLVRGHDCRPNMAALRSLALRPCATRLRLVPVKDDVAAWAKALCSSARGLDPGGTAG